jgi:AcrR family transcriptional regulator
VARKSAEARRDQIVRAAVSAIASRGIVDLRIRDIAEAAGVSTGTVHYHFSDLDGLLLSIHEMAVDRFVSGRREMLAPLVDARQKLLALAETGIPSGPDDELVVTLYDLGALFRRSPVHRTLLRVLYDQQVDLYSTAFDIGVAQGHFTLHAPAFDLAANAVALEDAYGLHIVTRNMSVSPQRAHRLLVLHLAEVTRCPDLLAEMDLL